MNPMQTNHPVALSILLNEELYFLDDASQTQPLDTVKTEPITTVEPILDDLPKEQIKELVPETLQIPVLPVKEELQQEQPVIASKPVFSYLGENNKYILIVVKESVKEFINQDELGFLLKILAAKKWELKDIAIINTEKYSTLNFDDLKDYFACSKILTFGINLTSLNIAGAVANKTLTYKDVKVLGTWTLAQLEKDVSKKTIYWNELKTF